MPNGGIDVSVRVVAEQPPNESVRLEGDRAPRSRRVEQEREDRVLGDVLSDVFFGVVRPHLLLIDVLLEDVADHIWVDLVVGPKRSVIQMPRVAVKEIEEPLE